MTRLFNWPAAKAWREAAMLLCLYSAITIPFGLLSGLVTFSPSADGLWQVALVAFFLPALPEELIFRGPLVFLSSGQSRFWTGAALLLLFVLWHPLNGLFLMIEARELFTNPRFLVMAFGLGLTSTFATLRTASLWPAIIIHWIVVVSWKGLFGGPQFLGG